MNVFKSNIYKYLGGTCQYVIPLYQRIYNWEYEQCMCNWMMYGDYRTGIQTAG